MFLFFFNCLLNNGAVTEPMNPQWETQDRVQTNDSYKSVRLVNQKHKALPVKCDSSNSNELTLFNKIKNIHEYNCECNQS